jgi:hypothetical protein
MSADEIRSQIKSRSQNEPLAQLCLRMIDYIALLRPEELRMLTFRTLTTASGKTDLDQELLAAVSLLSSSSFNALDTKALFIDEDSEEFEISLADLAYARARGEFIHPGTGMPVPDFEAKVVPFFVASERLLSR